MLKSGFIISHQHQSGIGEHVQQPAFPGPTASNVFENRPQVFGQFPRNPNGFRVFFSVETKSVEISMSISIQVARQAYQIQMSRPS